MESVTLAHLEKHYDAAIIGAGIAGLSLARQLLLNSTQSILLLERSEQIPPPYQKVGESCVQVSGYYFSKVLDMEEYLFREHYLKYNLRFYWKRGGTDGSAFEHYQSSGIRKFSNIASYQLNRNTFEAELLRRNQACENFHFQAGVRGLQTTLREGGQPHELSFAADGENRRVTADWVIDASGRNKVLAKQMGAKRKNAIQHGSSFMWVDGLVDIEKLTDQSPAEIRKRADRAHTGHLPFWLATNHFMGEGFWFWVIPLQGVTSLGLVYDKAIVDSTEVSTPERLTQWICREFPMFERALAGRQVVSRGSYPDFSCDCVKTISHDRWAMTGVSGRFSDPLYSPGGDLIAFYNTMIVDAIMTGDRARLEKKIGLYEQMMKWLYEAYVPTYAVSYDVLGDQEAFGLKYSWELAIYFGYYVFPFINDMFTVREFLVAFLGRFAKLGPVNRNVQRLLSGYFQWKKDHCPPETRTLHQDFLSLGPLDFAEKTFYKVGVTPQEARRVLDEQLASLEEFARYIIAWVCSRVLDDPSALHNRAFIESLDIKDFAFDVARIRQAYAVYADSSEIYRWPFDADVMDMFRGDVLAGGGMGTPVVHAGGAQ